jgi:hypothetical protein
MELTVGYRPIRIGWCVRPGNLDDLRRAWRLTHTLWGGRYNPVIPVGHLSDKDIVRAFAVDILIPADPSPELESFAHSIEKLYWPDILRRLFPDGAQSKSPSFVDVKRPIEQIREKRDRERATLRHAYLFEPDATDPLRDVLLAMFGGYPSAAEVGVDYISTFVSTLNAEVLRAAVLGPEIATALTPSEIAAWGLTTFDPHFMFEGENGLFIGSAASYEDLTAFWNLRAAGLNLRFVDRAHDNRLAYITEKWVQHLVQEHTVDSKRGAIGVWARTQSALDERPEIEDYPVARIFDDGLWGRLPTLPHYHWGEQRMLASLAFDPIPEYSFQLPPKPTGEHDDPLQNIGVTIRQHGDLTSSAKNTFLVPSLDRLNMFFSKRMYPIAPFSVRISRDYFTLCIPVFQTSLTIAAIEKTELVSEIFSTFGIKAELSQAGILAARLINQMGGLPGARLFRFPGVRRLIEEYTPLQHFTQSEAIHCIRDQDTGPGRVLFQRYFPPTSKWNPKIVFENLLERRVFRAGLEFRCPNCKLLFWAPIDSIGTEVTCDLCGDKFNCTPQLGDRGNWKFRRSGIFGKNDHQEGGIPVLLTLRQLSESIIGISMQPSVFATAMNLSPMSPEIPIRSCETDFVFVNANGHGVLNLVIGECKSKGGQITDNDLANLSAVASAIDATELRVFLLLAKTGDFTADEIARCKNTAASLSNRVILLSQRELDTPNFTYEWAAREFEVSSTAVDLDTMVVHTADIFFNPKPKH